MKKIILTGFAAATLLLVLNSCGRVRGSGPVGSENRTVAGSFNSVDVSAPLDVQITIQEGATASVQLNGYENLLKEIKTEIRNNTLRIYTPDGLRMATDKPLTAMVTVPSLAGLDLSGASKADVKGRISGDVFSVDISGMGAVHIAEVNTTKLDVDVSGAGDVSVESGTVQEASYSVSGTGDISAYGVQAKSAAAAVSGAGSIDLTATETLDAAISGAGSVKYKGHPKMSQHVSGAGSLEDGN